MKTKITRKRNKTKTIRGQSRNKRGKEYIKEKIMSKEEKE